MNERKATKKIKAECGMKLEFELAELSLNDCCWRNQIRKLISEVWISGNQLLERKNERTARANNPNQININ